MINKKILIATGNSQIDDLVQEYTGYNIIGKVAYSHELETSVYTQEPDILLVTEALTGSESLYSQLLKIKTNKPNTRIVYVISKLSLKNEKQVNNLALLVMAGIYDIVIEPKITIDMLKQSIDNIKTEDEVKYIVDASNIKDEKRTEGIEFIVPKELKNYDEELRRNLYAVSSVKPGTGKSFVSVNVAAAIAEFGVDKEDGTRPRVGLIEADLQNLSLGTLLQIEDRSRNIKTAMDKVSEIINEDGTLYGDANKIEEVNDFIKNCFVPYKHNSNLLALVGSHLTFEELENINRYHYIYLIESIIEEFDVLIIDTNSALTHTTTYPVLQIARACYYVINLDYNNARNNARYRETLNRMGLADKVKYVLNEDITSQMEVDSNEKLLFNSADLESVGFKLESKIPVIPKSIFLNRLYEGVPIALDKNKNTKLAREEIYKLANQMYPLKNM